LWTLLRRRDVTNCPNAELLSVYRDHGVVPRDSRDDNFNRPSADLRAYRHVRPGDLVLNKMKTWQGSLAVSEFEGIVSPAYFVCSLSGELYPRFAHYLLRSRPYIHMYQTTSKGIRPNQWDLPFEEFRRIPALLPPPADQRRIADFLDVATANLSSLVELRRKQRALLEERLDSCLIQTVLPLDGRKKWLPLRLKYLFEFERTGVWGEDPRGDGLDVLCVRVADFDRERLLAGSQAQTWRSVPAAQLMSRRLRPGDILLEKSGGGDQSPVGFAVNFDGLAGSVCSNFVAQLRPRAQHHPRFVGLLLAALCKAKRNLPFVKQTTGIQNLDAAGYLGQEIVVPEFAEQQALALVVDAGIHKVTSLVSVIDEQVSRIDERKATLITAAVTGQIDVTTAHGTTG
jgi:type I restriction enzyme S subunit